MAAAFSAIEQSGPLTLAATDLRHPIFRPFGALAANLGQVRSDRAWRVSPEGWSIVARFSNGSPALLERALGAGRVVLFASDLDRQWNDFPLHPAFVPFALEARAMWDMWEGIAGRRVTTPSARRRRERHPSQVSIETQEIDRLRSMSTRAKARSTGWTPRRSRPWCPDRSKKPRKLPRSRPSKPSPARAQYGLALLIATLVAESQ